MHLYSTKLSYSLLRHWLQIKFLFFYHLIPSFQSSNPHTQIIKVFSYSSLSVTNFSKVAVIPRRGGNAKEGQNLAKEPELS